jgi:CO/xanthine dehydrogenase FAD-binding subunit
MADENGVHHSRKLIENFTLHRPSSIGEACAMMADRGSSAVVNAGGIDVVNRLKAGCAIGHLVAIGGVEAMRGVVRTGDVVEIGAGTTHWEVEHSPLLTSLMPALPRYIAGLGNVRIRTQGTIGGNVMAGQPAYEILPLLQALGAELHFREFSAAAARRCPAREFPQSVASSLEPRLLTTIAIPLRTTTLAWNRQLRPQVGLVVELEWVGRHIKAGSAVVNGNHREPHWAALAFSHPLSSKELGERAASVARDWAGRMPDFGTPGGPDLDHCRRVVGVMLRRALIEMIEATQ